MDTVNVEELTIDSIHASYLSGTLSARSLTSAYIDRIRSIDTSGPKLNSIAALSSNALKEADVLDQSLKVNGSLVGPLHGVPIVIKDQIETAGIITTFGSVAAKDYIPERDAHLVTKLRAAGAIILGKACMPDWAAAWFSTSSLTGLTKNPYDLSRDPGGSSSGSGAAVAANLAAAAIGGDTGGSIRLPSSFCNLVGVRCTPGLISRDGMSGLVVPQDTPGPMCRTVKDASRLLDVLVGFDEKDPYTSSYAIANETQTYLSLVEGATLTGKRLGVLRQAFGSHAGVKSVIESTLSKLQEAGVELIHVEIPDLNHHTTYTSVYSTRSRNDINTFLSTRAPLSHLTIEGLHARGTYHKALDLIPAIVSGPSDPLDSPTYASRLEAQRYFVRLTASVFAKHKLDAIVFPDCQLPPPTHDEVVGGKWTCLTYPTNTVIASQLHFPAVSVPAGWIGAEGEPDSTRGLPVGLEIMGLPYQEGKILQVARGVEQMMDSRRRPSL